MIEIAARGGGNRISSVITQYMSEYDTYNYLIDSAMGKFVDYDFSIQKQFWERAAVLKFFHTPYGGGRVKNIWLGLFGCRVRYSGVFFKFSSGRHDRRLRIGFC